MSVINGHTKEDIEEWLQPILANEGLKDYVVEVSGSAKKGDGYLGDITFVNVSGETSSGPKDFNFVIKNGKSNETLRNAVPIRNAFENEIIFYEKILPSFKEFQKEKGIKHPFNNAPKCFGSKMLENMEVIVLQNLKKDDYFLHDRKKPMNMAHVTAVMKQYAKLHALSFALRDQRPELFKTLTGGLVDMVKKLAEAKDKNKKPTLYNEMLDLAREKDDFKMVVKIKAVEAQLKTFNDITDPDDPYAVILHGDCWNNNFMFKYEGDQTEKPDEVRLIDFQLSRLASPVYDLSYFLFTCLSYNDTHRFDEINNIYYNTLSDFLRQLGSDPDKMFPYEELMNQWKRFYVFGLIMMPGLVRMCLTEKDEVPSFQENAEAGKAFTDTFLFKVKNTEEFAKRTLGIMRLVADKEFV